MFLKPNLEALEKNAPLMLWLGSSRPDPENTLQNVFINDQGLMDWRCPKTGATLFSQAHPGSFYAGWLPEDKADVSATVIVGCNLGYGLNLLLSKTPNTHKVVVIEPRPEILMACLGQTDYRPFIEAKKLFFVPPEPGFVKQVLNQLDLQIVFGRVYLRVDRPSMQLGPEYAKWGENIKGLLENMTVELITLRKKQDVMVKNELGNFTRAMNDGSLNSLQNRARGVAAVIFGAGPSLKDFAPRFTAARSYALYTCAMQTLPVMQNLGIKPHLCLALDYDPSMLKLYDRLDPEFAQDVPLIYSTKLNPEVVSRYPGPTLPMWTLGGMGTYILQGRELILDAGGNVSLTLFRMLTWCGVSRVLFVGQDFAWSGNRTHAGGHHASFRDFTYNPRRHVKLTNRNNQTIYTSMPYLTALRDLERDVAKSEFPVFNLYGGGADIAGATPVTWEKAVAEGLIASEPGSLERFLTAFDNARTPRKKIAVQPRAGQWAKQLRDAQKHAEKLFKKLAKNQKEIHDLIRKVHAFVAQDPVYKPYLFNEIMDLGGLARTRVKYGPRDLAEFKQIVKRILAKTREMDLVLADPQAPKSERVRENGQKLPPGLGLAVNQ